MRVANVFKALSVDSKKAVVVASTQFFCDVLVKKDFNTALINLGTSAVAITVNEKKFGLKTATAVNTVFFAMYLSSEKQRAYFKKDLVAAATGAVVANILIK
jgi:hypothetical protein